MANNGLKQATIAYRISEINGEPLDVNGVPTRLSGRKQAIALKTGFSNPDSINYEVYDYFDSVDLDGTPTVTTDLDACPIGELSPWVLDGGTWGMAKRWYNNRLWEF